MRKSNGRRWLIGVWRWIIIIIILIFFFFSSRRRHTRYWRDWSSDVCSSDLSFILLELYQKSGIKYSKTCLSPKNKHMGKKSAHENNPWTPIFHCVQVDRLFPLVLYHFSIGISLCTLYFDRFQLLVRQKLNMNEIVKERHGESACTQLYIVYH